MKVSLGLARAVRDDRRPADPWAISTDSIVSVSDPIWFTFTRTLFAALFTMPSLIRSVL
jgi:hypothetical protein